MNIDTVKAAVTDKNVQDIIDTASYGGITYWATQPTEAEFEATPEGKEFTIVEVVDETTGERKAHYLSKDDIRVAYAKLLDLEQRLVGKVIHGYVIDSWRRRTDEDGIDCGDIDADVADCIIQVACFNEVVYG